MLELVDNDIELVELVLAIDLPPEAH